MSDDDKYASAASQKTRGDLKKIWDELPKSAPPAPSSDTPHSVVTNAREREQGRNQLEIYHYAFPDTDLR